MQTELTALESRHEHPPHTTRSPQSRRVSLLDRAALHVGLALITWGRRRGRVVDLVSDREQAVLAHRAHLAREESERVRTQHEAMYLSRTL